MNPTHVASIPSSPSACGREPGLTCRKRGRDRRFRRWIRLLPCCFMALPIVLPSAVRGARASLPTLAEATKGLERRAGLFDLYIDARQGHVWLRLPPPPAGSDEIGRDLYYEGLVRGLGSNPVGLDRAQLGSTHVVAFRRVGGRILVEEINTAYRALSRDPAERKAVAQSFATSVLWAGDLAAEDPDGSTLVDFTSFIVRDAHQVARTLQRSGQGSWKLDEKRSVADLSQCLAFPENLALEAVLTFQGDKPGSEVRATAPMDEAVTLVLQHMLLPLPDDGYRPRRFDPRAGCYALEFSDYAAALASPIDTRWIVRHRLEKTDPTSARSAVKKPIVYYVDRGVPEPVRSALIEGASWWARAFEEAGFVDAFRVELLPEGANPLDARYNVINWVHRATRGWSYGGSVVDPRTGEIIKGHVLLGSLRVRQDRLLFEGLAGAANSGSGRPDDPVQLALARIRQLAAHEVGHTLGIAHNFAASACGRASVMDYPAPLVRVTEDGTLDFSDIYTEGVGAWDVQTIRYGYTEFPPDQEAAGLEEIVQDGLRRGLLFLSDADARPAGAAQPVANLWDNGDLAEVELVRLLEVRHVALGRFGANNIASGQPLALLDEVLAPVYFMHRYQVDAAAKVLGGVDYRYAVRGDGQNGMSPLPAARQRQAMQNLLACLRAEELDLPEPVLQLLVPRPFGYESTREQFESATLPVFDALGAAATATDLVVRNLLQPQRCARMVDQHRRDPNLPGLEELLEGLRASVFAAQEPTTERTAEIQRAVQRTVVDALIDLASDASATAAVRSRVESELQDLHAWLQKQRGSDPPERAHRALLAADLARHLQRTRGDSPAMEAEPPPPGSPIGMAAAEWSGCSWAP